MNCPRVLLVMANILLIPLQSQLSGASNGHLMEAC